MPLANLKLKLNDCVNCNLSDKIINDLKCENNELHKENAELVNKSSYHMEFYSENKYNLLLL